MQQMFNKLKSSTCYFYKSILPTFTLILFTSCYQATKMQTLTAHAFRLKPGQYLKEEIQKYVVANKIQAGWISTCVGSLTQYNLRLANQQLSEKGTGYFEIVSLTGTVSVNGSHLHLAISDATGKTIGGHLVDSNIIYTTAEIVILSSDAFQFTREKDGTTPWEELQVKQAHK